MEPAIAGDWYFMSDGKAQEKPRKEKFLEGLENRVRAAASLGRVLVEEPRAFPGAAKRSFKRFLHDLWHARGGGMYACGFVVTFLWLEATALVGEVVSSGSFAGFLTEQFLEFIGRFAFLSLENTIKAFLWPLYLIGLSPLWGGVTLVVLWFAFPRFVKPAITRWLLDDDQKGTLEENEDTSS